jgi:hypothetical protein
MNWWEKLLEGAKGRFIRSLLTLGIGLALKQYGDNPWYIAAAPLIQALSKKLRDSYPGKWDWLPI